MYTCTRTEPVLTRCTARCSMRLHNVMLKFIVKHRRHCCAYACDVLVNRRAIADLVTECWHAAARQEKITAAVEKITPHKRCYAAVLRLVCAVAAVRCMHGLLRPGILICVRSVHHLAAAYIKHVLCCRSQGASGTGTSDTSGDTRYGATDTLPTASPQVLQMGVLLRFPKCSSTSVRLM